MSELTRWLDRTVRRLCDWLNSVVSGRHLLAGLGHRLAGIDGMTRLPVDRRVPSNVLHMHVNAQAPDVVGQAGLLLPNKPNSCGFWAYCYTKGWPCALLGVGKNAVGADADPKYTDLTLSGRDLCPILSTPGMAWYGCCQDPSGAAKMIAFQDCCKADVGWRLHIPCLNWMGAKNWCWDGQKEVLNYYCTVAVEQVGQDRSCDF